MTTKPSAADEPSGQPTQPITQEQAREAAARQVMAQLFEHAEVRDGNDPRCHIYGPNGPREEIWVVYPANVPHPEYVGPSWVVWVGKRSGKVLYSGLAPGEE